tara:strand:+ start:109304 stop:110074 length:771 start_codon:yes stop_codon:yes gene_type:complete
MNKRRTPSFKAVLQSVDLLGAGLYRLRFSMPVGIGSEQYFTHYAGQYCYVGLDERGENMRPYSIANAPDNDYLEFHLRVTGSVLCRSLCDPDTIGKTVYMSSPKGLAHYFDDTERDIVLFSGGTGYAPIRAMIEQLRQKKFSRKVTAFIAARDIESLYMLDEMAHFSSCLQNLTVHFCADKLHQPHDIVQEAFLDSLAHGVIGNYGDKRIYIAGPPPMVINMRDYILDNGAHDDLIHVDHEIIAQYLDRYDPSQEK